MFILAVFVFFAFRMMTTIEEQNQQLIASSGAFRELNARMTGLRNELSRKDDLLRMLSARNITVVLLKGTGSNRNAWGKILWDPAKRGAILHVEGLSPVTPGQEYQIWLVRGERAWSAGVFVVTAPGSTMFRIDTLPAVSPRGTTTIAVTLERTGGAVRPQGPVCMTGSAQM